MSEVKARANVLLEEAARPSLEEVGATLRRLGLSGYAAGAFCPLVGVPEATAGDLVRKTGIPDSKIYYALDELAERGLVEVQAGKPKTYRAVPPREGGTRVERGLGAKYERGRARGGDAEPRPRGPAGGGRDPVGAGSGREVRAGARGGAARVGAARASAGRDEVPADGHRVHRE